MKKLPFLLFLLAAAAFWFRFFFQPSPPELTKSRQPTGPKWKLVTCVQSWCKDCILEMPSIKSLQDYVGKDKLEVVVLSDEDSTKRARFEELINHLFPVQQSQGTFKLQGIFVYPTTWLLNPKGEKVLVHQEGYKWDSPEVIHLIQGVE